MFEDQHLQIVATDSIKTVQQENTVYDDKQENTNHDDKQENTVYDYTQELLHQMKY